MRELTRDNGKLAVCRIRQFLTLIMGMACALIGSSIEGQAATAIGSSIEGQAAAAAIGPTNPPYHDCTITSEHNLLDVHRSDNGLVSGSKSYLRCDMNNAPAIFFKDLEVSIVGNQNGATLNSHIGTYYPCIKGGDSPKPIYVALFANNVKLGRYMITLISREDFRDRHDDEHQQAIGPGIVEKVTAMRVMIDRFPGEFAGC